MLHAGSQIDILRERLLEILPQKKKPTISVITIGSLIRRHQNIIVFTEKIESLYSYIALAQFVSNTVVICCLGFIIVNVSNFNDFHRTLMYYTSDLFTSVTHVYRIRANQVIVAKLLSFTCIFII